MDWDDVRPTPKRAAVIGEDLHLLSVAELDLRISELKVEIVRVETALKVKRAQADAAAQLFKS